MMDDLIKLLTFAETMGFERFAALILLIAIVGFIGVFIWATIRYVPPFAKNTGRIADNLEAMNRSHSVIEATLQTLPTIDDKIDRIGFNLEEVKKKVDEIHLSTIKQSKV